MDVAVQDVDNKEDDFEEVLVYVDFPDFDECTFLKDTTTIQLFDLAGSTPRCKVGELNFVGQHETNLGTQLFVDKDTGKCIGLTTNVLNFKLSSIDVEPAEKT